MRAAVSHAAHDLRVDDEGITKRGRQVRLLTRGGYWGRIFPPQGIAGMALRFKSQLMVVADDEQALDAQDLVIAVHDVRDEVHPCPYVGRGLNLPSD